MTNPKNSKLFTLWLKMKKIKTYICQDANRFKIILWLIFIVIDAISTFLIHNSLLLAFYGILSNFEQGLFIINPNTPFLSFFKFRVIIAPLFAMSIYLTLSTLIVNLLPCKQNKE